MGSCLSKGPQNDDGDRATCPSLMSNTMHNSSSASKHPGIIETKSMEQLIVEIMQHTRIYHDGHDEDPPPLVQIGQLADTEAGWCNVLMGLVNGIPLHDPLSPSTIARILEFCPLPARDSILRFTESLELNAARCARAYCSEEQLRIERNILLLLGCIADKFPSQTSQQIVTKDLLEYLITFLVEEKSPLLVCAALVAVEKLSGAAVDKAALRAQLSGQLLLPLALHCHSLQPAWRRVGFAARWALDNIFTIPGRQYSFETVDTSHINVMLNPRDMTTYLKISPDGLEARCDSHSFESVRATLEIKAGGCWYYEVELITSGVMQIGWATKGTSFDSHEGYGVGDNRFSVAYDGCRRLVWHAARATRVERLVRTWRAGDVLGCLVDTARGEAVFSLNGVVLPSLSPAFLASSEGFYPAASFMADQQCVFNFGARPFTYAPSDQPFHNMNSHGTLSAEQKMIIPRRVEMEGMQTEQRPPEQRCAVCLEGESGYGIEPCRHSGFCSQCVLLLEECPLCRRLVNKVYLLST